ncbi:MAG: DUF2235 domain-containing protein [Ginsengibacter sp.]
MQIEYPYDTSDLTGVTSVIPGCSSHSHEDPPPDPLSPLNIRISVFMDGTLNNLFNTHVGGGQYSGEHVSYRNTYSNVARMAMNLVTVCSANTYHLPVYVQGIGSLAGRPDSPDPDVGTGWGSTGVEARVIACINHIRSRIQDLSRGNHVIQNLKIDAFGFSRGAAAARHFVHNVLQSGGTSLISTLRTNDHFAITEYRMPFIGLYDTVASFGVDRADDPLELNLDAIRLAQVEKVVQLAAADEHRFYFPLIDINSVPSPRGEQIFLPGAHSDIGGGYNNRDDGDRTEVNLDVFKIEEGTFGEKTNRIMQQKRYLERRGWYEPSELQWNPENPLSLVANRHHIGNQYSLVPLHIMKNKATVAELHFNLDDYPIPDWHDNLLGRIKTRIEDSRSDADTWLNASDEQLVRLRHLNLHFSSRYNEFAHLVGYKHGPQFYTAASPGTPESWSENNGHTLNGVRKRRIYHG